MIQEVLFFKDVISIAESLNNCGECYRLLNSYYEAIEMYEKALKLIWKSRDIY